MLLQDKVEFELSAISIPRASWWTVLQKEVESDSFYSGRHSQKYVKRDGVFFYKGKILLSPTSSLLTVVLTENHSTLTGGHFGYHKTFARVKLCFTWPNMQRSVKDFVRNCDICQRCKTECSFSWRTPSTTSNPRKDMVRYFHGFYRGASSIERKISYYGGGRPID